VFSEFEYSSSEKKRPLRQAQKYIKEFSENGYCDFDEI
jgi:hypothetical protein